MKWFSIKTFTPPTGQDLLLRIEKKAQYSCRYERYIIASMETIEDDLDSILNWEPSNGVSFDIKLEEYNVTHFSIIDPVEM